MKISARNSLKGKIVHLEEGAVNVEVSLELSPEIQITSIITKKAAQQLKLEVGKTAYAVIKASDVMMGTDH